MDPIERINIRGDSTFALLLEAQRRGHAISYYTPDRLALRGGKVFAAVAPLAVRDREGDHFTLGEPRRTELAEFDVVLLRQDPPFDLAYITTTHLLERIHPKTLVVNDPAQVRNAPGKSVRDGVSRPDAADADHARPREIKAFRAEHGDIVMKPLYGNGGEAVFRLDAGGPQFRLALRPLHHHLPRAMGGAEIPAGGEAGRQAHHPGRRRIRGRGQPRAGARRPALQHGARRHAEGHRADRARARDLRARSGRRCASAGSCSSAST